MRKEVSVVMYSGAYSDRRGDDMDEQIRREGAASPRFGVNMSGIEPTHERRDTDKVKKTKSTVSNKITRYEL